MENKELNKPKEIDKEEFFEGGELKMNQLKDVKEVKEVVINSENVEEVNRLLNTKWKLLQVVSTSKGLVAVFGRFFD